MYHSCLLLEFWMLLPAGKKAKIGSDEQHANFAQELQSVLKLTVGFSNIYFEL